MLPFTDLPGVELERSRVEALDSFEVLDTAGEEVFDRLTADAARACRTPFAALNLVHGSRVWPKAAAGYSGASMERGGIPCEVVVTTGLELAVADLRADRRFVDSPLVVRPPLLRAYAAIPLMSAEGLAVGALCAMDTRPRPFTGGQLRALRDLADHAVALLELRRSRLRSGGRTFRFSTAEIGAALRRGEFGVVHQPVVDLGSGAVVGSEALARWYRTDGEVVLPADFMPQMEATSLVVDLGRTVLVQAAAATARFRRHSPAHGFAVNTTGQELRRPGLARAVLAGLADAGVPADALRVELTETGDGGPVVRGELEALSAAGVGVAIDDFGVGYSSMPRLLDLPFRIVKIDRGIVARAARDPRARALLAGVAGACRGWGMSVVAEGIETPVENEVVREVGCTLGQGWLHGRPMAADAFEALLAAGSAG